MEAQSQSQAHAAPLFSLSPIAPASPCREAAEGFIASAFLDKHGARVREFLPELVGLQSRAGDLRAVAGYRSAGTGALFLEQYLAHPVEQDLSAQVGTAISRDQIAEVGNLAGGSCRYARHLVSLLPRFLFDHGYTWVVFTATSVVRDILTSVGATLVELAPADASRLAGGADAWGRYYQNDPRVMAAYLPTGLHLSSRRRHRR
jgi:Thermostable hemolysin